MSNYFVIFIRDGKIAMSVCTIEGNTSVWMKLLKLLQKKKLWPVHEVQRQREAQLGLRQCIQNLQDKEVELKGELRNLADQARVEQKHGNKGKLKMLLTSSSGKRANLSLTARKRLALEQQLEALSTTQLNQEVLSSMQQTSAVLKSMGLEDKLATTDEVMQELEESQLDIAGMQDALSTAVATECDDNALEAELELLLHEVPDMEIPVTINSIDKRAVNDKKDSSEAGIVTAKTAAAVTTSEEASSAANVARPLAQNLDAITADEQLVTQVAVGV